MLHSIIVPHFNRNNHLRQCLASVRRSALICRCPHDSYEVIVVDGGSNTLPDILPYCRLVVCTDAPPVRVGPNEAMPFWKARLLNAGIREAKGEVLTFLDADAVVGEQFMQNTVYLLTGLTKLAYRVRYAPVAAGQWNPDDWRAAFSRYDERIERPDAKPIDRFQIAFEGYGQADTPFPSDAASPPAPAFGNSQFSILRSVLGDLRYDENYIGRGFEDISLNRSVWERDKAGYRCDIITDPAHAMFHMDHEKADCYAVDKWNARNHRRYYGKKMVWVVANNTEFFRRFSNAVYCIPQLPCGFTYVILDDWKDRRCETNSDIDQIVCECTTEGKPFLIADHRHVPNMGRGWSDRVEWLAVINFLGIHGTYCQLQNSLKAWEDTAT